MTIEDVFILFHCRTFAQAVEMLDRINAVTSPDGARKP